MEAGEFRRVYEDLRKAEYDVVGVSTDSQEENDRFRESLDLPYPLVGDPEGKIVREYDVRWPLVGRARRVTYIVERDKKVQFAFGNETNMKAHAQQACQYADERAR